MIWQNPFAWWGLLALGVPLVIHLLSRRRSRVLRFPTIQFIGASALPPRRRARLTDLLLLALRLVMLAVAVAALAQPLLLTADRKQRLGRDVARAIVLDTSASMQRAAVNGQRAVDVARSAAQRLADAVPSSVVISTNAPRHALHGAIEWLEAQPGRHEIAVVSDFQLGTLEVPDITSIPTDVGILLERIDASGVAPQRTVRMVGRETTTHIALSPDRTDVEWTSQPTVVTEPPHVKILAGSREQDLVHAVIAAVRSTGIPDAGNTHPITIVLPLHEQRAQLMRNAKAIDRRWMGDVVARLHNESNLERVATSNDTLLLFSTANAGMVDAATLVAAAARAATPVPPAAELEPANLTDAQLTAWQRAAATAAAIDRRVTNGASDGRWLWLMVLVLLAAEALVRRGRASRLAV